MSRSPLIPPNVVVLRSVKDLAAEADAFLVDSYDELPISSPPSVAGRDASVPRPGHEDPLPLASRTGEAAVSGAEVQSPGLLRQGQQALNGQQVCPTTGTERCLMGTRRWNGGSVPNANRTPGISV